MKPAIAVTIANWNGHDMLTVCLQSLRTQTIQATEIIIVDNGSTDNSLPLIQSQFPEVTLIALTDNSGFAAAHNIAIDHAFQNSAITHVLTLNNDTELAANFIEEMLRPFEHQPLLGSVQGKIVRMHETEIIDCTGVLIHRDMSGFNRGQNLPDDNRATFAIAQEIMGPSASAAVYARHALEAVALPVSRTSTPWRTRDGADITQTHDYFDSLYFAYYEDVDLLWRLRLAGYSSWYTPNAVAFHAHSATGVVASPFKAFHIHRNHFFNVIKDTPMPFLLWTIALIPARYIMLVLAVLRGRGAASRLSQNVKNGTEAAVAKTTQSNSGGGAKQMVGIVFRAWKDVLLHLPELLKKRRHIQKNRTASNREVNRWFREYAVSWSSIFFE